MKTILTRLLATLLLASVFFGGVLHAEYDNEVKSVQTNSPVDDAECSECGITIGSRLWELFVGSEDTEVASSERIYLVPGGKVFGTRVKETRVSVATPDEGGVLAEGDKIISINGKDITSISEIKQAVSGCGGAPLKILCMRSGKEIALELAPKSVGGEYRLGAVLREGAAGIGTVTYIDPKTGAFGGLGHGICDSDSGDPIEVTGGVVTGVILGRVIRGEAGKPGELSGILTDKKIGEIYSNTVCGVFGSIDLENEKLATPIPIAYKDEVRSGEATIISTLKNGTPMEYKIEIYDINKTSTTTKSFKINVTDEALLAISGGIVRGMSGSPIIQNGKLVGAVTHVMINDPTRGYGIFIENMLDASQQKAEPKAA